MHYTLTELRDLCDEAEQLVMRLSAQPGWLLGPKADRLRYVTARAEERLSRRLRMLYPPRPIPLDIRPTEERSW